MAAVTPSRAVSHWPWTHNPAFPSAGIAGLHYHLQHVVCLLLTDCHGFSLVLDLKFCEMAGPVLDCG